MGAEGGMEREGRRGGSGQAYKYISRISKKFFPKLKEIVDFTQDSGENLIIEKPNNSPLIQYNFFPPESALRPIQSTSDAYQ